MGYFGDRDFGVCGLATILLEVDRHCFSLRVKRISLRHDGIRATPGAVYRAAGGGSGFRMRKSCTHE